MTYSKIERTDLQIQFNFFSHYNINFQEVFYLLLSSSFPGCARQDAVDKLGQTLSEREAQGLNPEHFIFSVTNKWAQ